MRLALAVILLAASALLARTEILIHIEDTAKADSVIAEIQKIEPRMGQIMVINSRGIFIGYMADTTAADTLRFSRLKGKRVKMLATVDSLFEARRREK